MEPRRILVIDSIPLNNGQFLQQWTYVWKLEEELCGMVLIEHKNHEYKIPANQTVETPVPAPSMDRLTALDPCFVDLKRNLQEVYRNDSYMFIIYSCPHGNYFMEDTQGGIAMFNRWIYLSRVDDLSDDNLKRLWSKYHNLPYDALYYMGIAL